MWQIYQKCKTFSQRPSSLLQISDAWASYQFDGAVNLVGIIIENALQEQHNVGTKRQPEWRAKYTLSQLLDEKFRLPAPKTEKDRTRESMSTLRAIGNRGGRGVKVLKGGE